MSYDLRIWETPPGQTLPKSFEEAASAVFALERLEAAPNPKFMALAAQMARYKGCGEGPWIGDLVAEAQRCNRGAWVFLLPVESRMRLMYVVVRMANDLGLTVLDDQLGMVLLPPQTVLPLERASVWRDIVRGLQEHLPSVPTDVPTLDWARGTMRAELTAILAPLGFISPRQPLDLPYYHVQTEATYFRPTPAGGQAVTLASSTQNNLPCITIDVNVFSDEIADILRVVFPEHDEMYFRRQLNFYVGLFRSVFAYGPVESRAALYSMVDEMRDPVLTILEITRTPLGMEAVMGGGTDFQIPSSNQPSKPQTLAEHAQWNFGYAALVSAWLYGGERFHTAAQAKREREARNAPEPMKEEMVERVDRLVAYLRGDVRRKA